MEKQWMELCTYELDVLEMLREWAEEFENWWLFHDEDWRDCHDYLEEVWDFTEKKSKEYVSTMEG